MARSGLAELRDHLRGMSDAGYTDWTLGTATFWDIDHLDQVLDRHRIDVSHEELTSYPTYLSGGTVHYKEYRSVYRNWEQTTGGTAIFELEDSTGANVGTASYSVDYLRGIVTFGTNTLGSAYYVTGRSYNLNAAASDIWRIKAANVSKQYSFATDSHNLQRGQIMAHYITMAEYYDSLGEVSTTVLERSDVT